MTEQRKAVIKNADMSEEMQQDAVDIASQALAKYNIEKVRICLFFMTTLLQEERNLSNAVNYGREEKTETITNTTTIIVDFPLSLFLSCIVLVVGCCRLH